MEKRILAKCGRKKAKCGRKKAPFGTQEAAILTAAGINAAASTAAAAIGASATKDAANKQAQSTISAAQRQAQAIKDQTNISKDYQLQAQNFVKKENTSNEVLTILFSTIDYYLLVDSAFEFAIQFSLKECQQLTDFLLY